MLEQDEPWSQQWPPSYPDTHLILAYFLFLQTKKQGSRNFSAYAKQLLWNLITRELFLEGMAMIEAMVMEDVENPLWLP